VALTADGDTALVGGAGDNAYTGAAWVYTRSGGAWSQQGPKLVGTGASGTAEQGWSVALSADGDTAVVGGPQDGSLSGAVWEFTRSAGVWAQRGSKLVGAGALGLAQEGASVAISADGATAVVGGPTDYWAGATWAFATPGCAPSITSQPQSQRVGAGLSATLSVAAVGTAPLAYQWYEGVAGDASHPVGTDAATFTTPALTVATSYWVRVSNSCGHAYSATAIVTVGSSPRRHLRRAG